MLRRTYLGLPPPPKDIPTVDAAGMSLAKVTPELRRDLELPEDAKGVVVVDVDDGGPAAKRGVQAGDVVAIEPHPAGIGPQLPAELRDQSFVGFDRRGVNRGYDFDSLAIGIFQPIACKIVIPLTLTT